MAPWRGIGATLGSLRGAERLAAIGAAAVPVSLLLPWYGYRFLGGLSQTGLDAFGFGQAALLVTVAATLFLIVSCARGYRPPRPLSEGALLIAAGVWMAILLGYLIVGLFLVAIGFAYYKSREIPLYQSTASMRVEKPEKVVTSQEVVETAITSDVELNTYLQVIRSASLRAKVVASFTPDEIV